MFLFESGMDTGFCVYFTTYCCMMAGIVFCGLMPLGVAYRYARRGSWDLYARKQPRDRRIRYRWRLAGVLLNIDHVGLGLLNITFRAKKSILLHEGEGGKSQRNSVKVLLKV